MEDNNKTKHDDENVKNMIENTRKRIHGHCSQKSYVK